VLSQGPSNPLSRRLRRDSREESGGDSLPTVIARCPARGTSHARNAHRRFSEFLPSRDDLLWIKRLENDSIASINRVVLSGATGVD
jgi:hypothetical protein